MKRRFLSILLVCAMIITMLPQGVSATGGTNSLTAGNTYYFDLSNEGIPGTINDDLPDTTLHYVPFTYAEEITAYVLKSASAGVAHSSRDKADMATSDTEYGHRYAHRLFIAEYNIAHTVSWDTLNGAGIIFGKTYTAGSVEYMLRVPSVGESYNGNTINDYSGGYPVTNEWDVIHSKGETYIKNLSNEISSWGQDTYSETGYRSVRGKMLPQTTGIILEAVVQARFAVSALCLKSRIQQMI